MSGSSPTTFNPSGRVTRQDICVMVYNYYTKYLGRAAETTDESVMAAAFSDWGRVSGYAKEAVRWANKTTFMRGASATTLDPTGYASRAQLAQFLKNLDAVVEPSTDPSPSPSSSPSPSPSPSPNPGNVFPLAMKKPLSIVAGPSQTLAINSDGTVRAAGLNEGGGLNVGGWTDIVSLSSVRNQTLGVKSDGTVWHRHLL